MDTIYRIEDVLPLQKLECLMIVISNALQPWNPFALLLTITPTDQISTG